MSTLGFYVLESVWNHHWFKLPLHATLKTSFAKTGSGGGFGEFDSAESNLQCRVDRGIKPELILIGLDMHTNGQQVATFSLRNHSVILLCHIDYQ